MYYDYNPTRIPVGGGQLRQFFPCGGALLRNAALVEHAGQVARRGAGRGTARPFEDTRHPDRGGRGSARKGPGDAHGLQRHPRGGLGTEGRDGRQTASGSHPDHCALPAAQVYSDLRTRLSEGRTGNLGDDYGRHRRGAQARPHRCGAGGQRHLRRGDHRAGALQRPLLLLRLARKSALRAFEHPHRGF